METADDCKCEEKLTMRCVLSNCWLALDRGYTWHDNHVPGVISATLKEKIEEYNRGEYPKVEKRRRIYFQKEGKGYKTRFRKLYEIRRKMKGTLGPVTDLVCQ